MTQNQKVREHLEAGKSITWLDAFQEYGIAALHSRISDLRNNQDMAIDGQTIYVRNRDGEKVRVMRYTIANNDGN